MSTHNKHLGVNFIYILHAHFSYKILAKKLQSCVWGLKLCDQLGNPMWLRRYVITKKLVRKDVKQKQIS